MHSGTLAPRVEHAVQCRKALLAHDDALREDRDTAKINYEAEAKQAQYWHLLEEKTRAERDAAQRLVGKYTGALENVIATARRRGVERDAAIEAGKAETERANANWTSLERIKGTFSDSANELSALRTKLTALERDAQIIHLVDRTVGDDFCEDLDMRAEDLTGDAKVMHRKLSFLYRIAHSARRDAVCYGRHDDWRKEADDAIVAMQRDDVASEGAKP